ncbi:hypothetical protein, partial [Roseibacillus persicicus]|uniref:hypothetical protein n=1 Tax=Roseibacillus persicicus TaxID=454148 RepID=UPI00280E45EA
DWLPLPDKFVWPEPTKVVPKFESKYETAQQLSEQLKKAIRGHWPENKLPEKLEIARVDLNNDGSPEVFVGIPAYSGSGGTYYSILTESGQDFREIGSLLGFNVRFHSSADGWPAIEGRSNAGGGHHTRYLLEFRDGRYSFSRIENHDLVKKKVTISKTGNAQQDAAPKSDPRGG